jgi:hypothetical protein
MSWAQPIIQTSEPSTLRSFLVRHTYVDTVGWQEIRSRGRKHFVGFMVGIGWGAPAVMLLVHVLHISRSDLPWSVLWSWSFLSWFVPLLVLVPGLMHLLAPLEWSLIEEKYRAELLKQGRRPAPLPD